MVLSGEMFVLATIVKSVLHCILQLRRGGVEVRRAGAERVAEVEAEVSTLTQ